MFFDTHAHLYDRKFKESNAELATMLKKADVVGVMIPSESRANWDYIRKMSEEDIFYPGYGIHPQRMDSSSEEDLELLDKYISEHGATCVGEIGLDLYWRQDNLEKQKHFFIEQIKIANKHKLPISIHDRDANKHVLEIVSKYADDKNGIIMHCFSASEWYAKEYLALGAYISLAGPVTYKNAVTPKKIAAMVDEDRLLIETDSPYLTPHPFRGKRNDPSHVRFTASTIASIRGVTTEEIAIKTLENAKRVFKL